MPLRLKSIADSATFICGHPKSGTSLLASLFDSHPQLLVYPEETLFFRNVLPGIHIPLEESRIQNAKDWLLRIFHWDPEHPHPSQKNYPGRDYSTLDYDSVSNLFDEFVNASASSQVDLLPCAVFAYGQASRSLSGRTLRWVEKSPYNENYAKVIFASWKDARCIHIVRDPRDNYASYVLKHPDWTPEVFARSWLRSIRNGVRNLKAYGQKRYKLIKYESLVSQPEDALRTLALFLGIENNDTMLTPTRAGKAWQGNSMFGDRYSGISGSSVERFRANLEPDVIHRLEELLYPEMKQFDYVLDSHLTWIDKISSLGTRTYWDLQDKYAEL